VVKLDQLQDEVALEQEVLTKETQKARDAMKSTEEYWWEILSEYMKDTDTDHF
jgi:hypothetical protein